MGLTIRTANADIKVGAAPITDPAITFRTKIGTLSIRTVEGYAEVILSRGDVEHLVEGLQALLARR